MLRARREPERDGDYRGSVRRAIPPRFELGGEKHVMRWPDHSPALKTILLVRFRERENRLKLSRST